MNEPHYLLTCTRLPGRVDAEGAAVLLGFAPHDLPILTSAKLLKPLGKPGQRNTKYYATAELLELCRDIKWLSTATRTIAEAWQERNAQKGVATSPKEVIESRPSEREQSLQK